MNREAARQQIFRGIPASGGIAIATAFLLERETDLYIPLRKISEQQVKREVAKYRAALDATRRELDIAKEQVLRSLGKSHGDLADIYVSIMNDPLLTRDVVRMIERDLVSAEYAVSAVLSKVIESFEKIEDEYFKGRTIDIRDVGRKIMRNIIGKERKSLAEVDTEDVVVAHTLSPSDTVILKEKKCKGFVVDIGSKTSHIALVAQGLQLPAVVGLKNITEAVEHGDRIIIDGYEGVVIINPDGDSLRRYTEKYTMVIRDRENLARLRDLPAQTLDGHPITLMCNLDSHLEVDDVIETGAAGVGLFRTEYHYIDRDTLPTEEELFEIYAYVARKLNPRPVVFRTFDIGGDKISRLGLQGFFPESSPALGLRGIRLSLKYPDIFKTQLRALLRASAYGNTRIMFPLISGVKEFMEARAIVAQVKAELKAGSVEFDPNVQIGAMIEQPSAALTADIIAREADFCSIGTNDLIQYTLAVDRMNENVADMYEPFHLSILRLIKHIVTAVHARNKPVAMCGEMASDMTFTKLLIGIGLNDFSVPPALVLQLKKLIRGFSLADAGELEREVFGADDRDAVEEILKNDRARGDAR
jgi:phosphotransferase system enzyme I (PtsI)